MDLIPGLTDDLARECLIRIPLKSFRSVSSICKAWNLEIRSAHFHHCRRLSGQTRPIFVLAKTHRVYSHNTVGKDSPNNVPLSYLLTVFDPESGSWTRLPPGPDLAVEFSALCGVIGVGSKVIVIGSGFDQGTGLINTVHVFDFLTSQWYRGAHVPGPGRLRFGLGKDPFRHQVVVAGGYVVEKRALKSALLYDVEKDTWIHLGDMKRERDECNVVFHGGKLHAISGYSFPPRHINTRSAESLDLDTLKWGPINDEFLEYSMKDVSWMVMGNGKGDMVYMGRNVAVRLCDGAKWEAVTKVPDELRYRKCGMTWQDKTVVIGGQVFGGPNMAYVLDMKSREWINEDLPSEYVNDAFVLGCGMEL